MLCMGKEIKIKSNGLRNELKEIRKSIDKLTNVVEHIIDIWASTQTHKQYEKYTINHSDHAPDGMRWVTTVSKDETDQSRKDDVLHDFD